MKPAKEIVEEDGCTEHDQFEGYVLKVQDIVDYMEQYLEINEFEIIKSFWVWVVRKANIEVIDAETAIGVRGFMQPKNNLVPVVSFKELFDLYKHQNEL